jgi:hypothetical protein
MEESGRTLEKLRGLLGKAEKGDEDVVPEIRQILNEPMSPRTP